MKLQDLLSCVAILALVAGPVQAKSRVGVSAAVLPNATGTPPDDEMRVLQIGIDMFANERVETGPRGKAQLLFLDGTALSVGPNSDLRLDEFVYDPDAKAGKLALSATKGVFRIVGGRISKKSPITLKTPSATIGIRGGIAMVAVAPNKVQASFLFGHELTVTTPDGVSQVDRPGTQVSVETGKPVQVAPASAGVLSDTLNDLEGTAAQQPADAPAVQDGDIAGSQLGSLGSAVPPQQRPESPPSDQAGPVGDAAEPGEPGPVALLGGGGGQSAPTDILLGGDFGGLADASQDSATDDLVEMTPGGLVPTVPLANPVPTATAETLLGGRYVSDSPFVEASFDADTLGANLDGQRNLTFADGQIFGGWFTATVGGQMLALPVPGSGAFSFGATGTATPFGQVAGTGFASADGRFAYFDLREVGAGNNPASLFAGAVPASPDSDRFRAFAKVAGFPGAGAVPYLPDSFGGEFADATFAPGFWAQRDPATQPSAQASSVAGWGAVVIQGQGANQRSAGLATVQSLVDESGTGKKVLAGFQDGSVRLAGAAVPERVAGGASSLVDAAGNAFFGPDGKLAFHADGPDLFNNAGVRRNAVAAVSQFDAEGSIEPFYRTTYNVRVALPNGVGATRTARTLNGYSAGIATSLDVVQGVDQIDGEIIAVRPPGAVGDNDQALSLAIVTMPDRNRVTVDMTVSPRDLADDRLDLFFGNGTGAVRSAFIDDNIFVLRESNLASRQAEYTSLGVSDTVKASGAFMTDAFFADRSAVPAAVSFCACAATEWGFWFGDASDDMPLAADLARVRAHLVPWVAGVLPSLASVGQQTGTAQYAGHAVGAVLNQSDSYIAFANFTMNWNFGSDRGTLKLPNLDGRSYVANMTTRNGRDLAGGLVGTDGPYAGDVIGSFFMGGNAAAEFGAQFAVQRTDGTEYEVAGILQGKRGALPAGESAAELRLGGLFVTGDPVVGESGGQTAEGVRDSNVYRPFRNGLGNGGVLSASAGGAAIRLPIQDGSFSFAASAAGGTQSPAGPVSGNATVSLAGGFAYYNLVTSAAQGAPAAVFFGVPAVGSAPFLTAYNLTSGFPDNASVPFFATGLGSTIPNAVRRPMYLVQGPPQIGFEAPSTRAGWGLVTVSGSGSSQESAMVGAVQAAFRDATTEQMVLAGAASGFARKSVFNSPIFTRSGVSVVPDANGVWAFGRGAVGPEFFVLGTDRYQRMQDEGTRTPSQIVSNVFDSPVSGRNYQQQVASRVGVPGGVGQQRSVRSLRGYAAGLATKEDPAGSFQTIAMVNREQKPANVVLDTNPDGNRAAMRLDLADVTAGSLSLELYFGTPAGSLEIDRSAFIDDRIIVMRDSAGGEPLPGNQTVPGEGGRINLATQAKVDGVALTDYWYADRQAVPANVTLCGCDFLTWGFWGADVSPLNNPLAPSYRFALAGFVTGDLPTLGEIPAAGTATYDGHAVANVRNGSGQEYVAFGNYQQTWDFASRAGATTISNLDGGNYTAASTSPNGRDLNGSLGGTAGRIGSYQASFFRNGGDAVGGIAGDFEISGTGYRAVGIVLGDRQ
ncbi:MAG: FecR domain-containing protein [Alphaproteobacteria bacterium]